jgi:hypothetical protein
MHHGDASQNADDQPKKPKKRSVPGFVQGTLMADMVAEANGKLSFATNDSSSNKRELTSDNGKVLVPPQGLKAFLENGSLLLPSRAERGFTSEQVIAESIGFLYTWADMPDDWLIPIAHYPLMTWVYDRFNAMPYLRFIGEYGTGKTRMLQVVAALCYRSVALSGNITGAALFRSIDVIRGTLAVDEADFKHSAEWSDITKVLNNGYAPGFPIVRCDSSTRAFSPQSFWVYGPKIISTRHRFDDPATESRCITFETQERKVDPRIPLQLPPAFYQEAQALRNKLLGWRFDNFHNIQADDSMLRHLDPRIAQMGASLLAVAPDKETIAAFLNGYSQNAKEDSPREIVKQILGESRGKVSVAQVTESANQRLQGSGLDQLTHKAVGSIVRSLGYRTRRKNTGYVIERQ